MRTIWLLLFPPLLGACGPAASTRASGDDVSLSVDAGVHTPGDTVVLTLRNATTGTIGYNLCASTLERRSGDGWERVPEGRMCTMELRALEPADSANQPLALGAGLAGGEYRYTTVVTVPLGGTRRDIATEAFRVR